MLISAECNKMTNEDISKFRKIRDLYLGSVDKVGEEKSITKTVQVHTGYKKHVDFEQVLGFETKRSLDVKDATTFEAAISGMVDASPRLSLEFVLDGRNKGTVMSNHTPLHKSLYDAAIRTYLGDLNDSAQAEQGLRYFLQTGRNGNNFVAWVLFPIKEKLADLLVEEGDYSKADLVKNDWKYLVPNLVSLMPEESLRDLQIQDGVDPRTLKPKEQWNSVLQMSGQAYLFAKLRRDVDYLCSNTLH